MEMTTIISQSTRSLGTSRASVSRWDGLLTTADLGVSHNGNARSGARHLDKVAVLHQIKHNCDMETHTFRSRILEATDEATRAHERIDDVYHEMLRLRKKCFKLSKLLQERDATIACMQEQHDLQLPMLMRETMRSLHNAVDDNNQNQNDLDHAHTMRSSIHRNRVLATGRLVASGERAETRCARDRWSIYRQYPCQFSGLVEYDGKMLGFEDIFLFKDRIGAVAARCPPSVRVPPTAAQQKEACEALGTPEHAKRVHMMPNPCTFSVNEVVFGISTLDIVMHLSSNELHRASCLPSRV